MQPTEMADLPALGEVPNLANSLIQESPAWLSKLSDHVSDGPKFQYRKYFVIGNEVNVRVGSCHFYQVRKGDVRWKLQIAISAEMDTVYYLSPVNGWIPLFREDHHKGFTLNKYLKMAVKILT